MLIIILTQSSRKHQKELKYNLNYNILNSLAYILQARLSSRNKKMSWMNTLQLIVFKLKAQGRKFLRKLCMMWLKKPKSMGQNLQNKQVPPLKKAYLSISSLFKTAQRKTRSSLMKTLETSITLMSKLTFKSRPIDSIKPSLHVIFSLSSYFFNFIVFTLPINMIVIMIFIA